MDNLSDLIPTTAPGVYDQDGILAANLAVQSMYRVKAAMPGSTFTFSFVLTKAALAGYGTQPTSLTVSVNIGLLVTDASQAAGEPYEYVFGQEIDNQTTFTFTQAFNKSVQWAAFASDTQLDTGLSGLSVGADTLNAEQIADLEVATANDATISGVAISTLTEFVILVRPVSPGPIAAASAAGMTLFTYAGVAPF